MTGSPSTGWASPRTTPASVTYAELKDEVCKAANALTELGVAEGRPGRHLHADDPRDGRRDAGLRPDRRPAHRGLRRLLRRRARDPRRRLRREGDHHRRRRLPARRGRGAQAGRRRGAARRPRSEGHTVEKVLVVRRTGQDVDWNDDGRRLVARRRRPGVEPSTSASSSTPSTRSTSCTPPGSTGKPKGILHTTGGYLTGAAYTHWAVFDLKPETDVYWCTADVGWVTGHSYMVYGPLANAATQVHLRGHAGHARRRAAGGRSSRTTRSRSSTPRPPRSARS